MMVVWGLGVFYRDDTNIFPTWVEMAHRDQRNRMMHEVIHDDRGGKVKRNA